MTSAFALQETRGVTQEIGTVVRSVGGRIVVRTGTLELSARRAVSCLLEPEVDDRVLVAVAPDREAYVLAILEREAGRGATLGLTGDLEVRIEGGRFDVKATEGIGLGTAKGISLLSSVLELRAIDARAVLERLSVLGGSVKAELQQVKLEAGSLDTVLDRLHQKVKRAYRFVEELDHLRAERIDHAAEKTLSLRAENALVHADKLVKLNGDQIHLG